MQKLSKSSQSKLESMYEAKGSLTTKGVLTEAKRVRSVLHKEFNWDDTKAAIEYRMIQARRLIKRYNVIIEDPGERLVHVPAIVRNAPGEYKKSKVVVKTISEFERAMTDALKRLSAAKYAVETLESSATLEVEDDRLPLLTLALKGIDTATSAIRKLH